MVGANSSIPANFQRSNLYHGNEKIGHPPQACTIKKQDFNFDNGTLSDLGECYDP